MSSISFPYNFSPSLSNHHFSPGLSSPQHQFLTVFRFHFPACCCFLFHDTCHLKLRKKVCDMAPAFLLPQCGGRVCVKTSRANGSHPVARALSWATDINAIVDIDVIYWAGRKFGLFYLWKKPKPKHLYIYKRNKMDLYIKKKSYTHIISYTYVCVYAYMYMKTNIYIFVLFYLFYWTAWFIFSTMVSKGIFSREGDTLKSLYSSGKIQERICLKFQKSINVGENFSPFEKKKCKAKEMQQGFFLVKNSLKVGFRVF